MPSTKDKNLINFLSIIPTSPHIIITKILRLKKILLITTMSKTIPTHSITSKNEKSEIKMR
uniref:Candidate secreted effector n=1 Tax=Meloidogyne incognita TaxID=6306 RepID=A0A914LBI5_MELIC